MKSHNISIGGTYLGKMLRALYTLLYMHYAISTL